MSGADVGWRHRLDNNTVSYAAAAWRGRPAWQGAGMPVQSGHRRRWRARVTAGVAGFAVVAVLAGCGSPAAAPGPIEQSATPTAAPAASVTTSASLSSASPKSPAVPTPVPPAASTSTASSWNGSALAPTVTATPAPIAGAEPDSRSPSGSPSGSPGGSPSARIAFVGDVNFAERTADRLAADPSTVFGAAASGLASADLTVANLETAIATGGAPEPKSFTFRAPPSALTAVREAGIDVVSMANNHGADFGAAGLAETVAAISAAKFPVIGIGADEAQAMTPYRATVGGVDLTIFAVSAVRDHTLDTWTAGPAGPGIASAFDPRLMDDVRAAAAADRTVVVFLHWGTEYVKCPDGDQGQLADELAAAGATAVVGAHAHVLQGAGWRDDGVYVAYGLSNYLWWRSFGNAQDDNGVLTLTVVPKRVIAADFAPAHLDDSGVPVPASGTQAARINAQWEQARECAGLAAQPPG